MNLRLLLISASITAAAHAGTRSSANYTIAADTTDAGGKRAASASYTNDGSIGEVVGIASVTAPAETTKSGYIAQLYDVTGLVLNASSLTVNETSTLQLGAWQTLDDATLLAVPATSVNWSVANGPISSIASSGLATAGVVYQDTPATVQASYASNTASLSLTVLDSIPDNFGAYAGDGIADSWQVQYFGLPPNANAAPNVDYDGTGQTNLFKYIAGLNPLDPNSRFTLNVQPVPGQPSQKNLVFSPIVAGRTYTITSKPVLATGSYAPLANPSVPSDNGSQRTVTDLSASGVEKFYRVEITKP